MVIGGPLADISTWCHNNRSRVRISQGGGRGVGVGRLVISTLNFNSDKKLPQLSIIVKIEEPVFAGLSVIRVTTADNSILGIEEKFVIKITICLSAPFV